MVQFADVQVNLRRAIVDNLPGFMKAQNRGGYDFDGVQGVQRLSLVCAELRAAWCVCVCEESCDDSTLVKVAHEDCGANESVVNLFPIRIDWNSAMAAVDDSAAGAIGRKVAAVIRGHMGYLIELSPTRCRPPVIGGVSALVEARHAP
jgi:hypothetical protein